MKKRNKIYSFITCSSLLFIFAACQINTIYHQYQPVSKTGWSVKDTLFFKINAHIPKGEYEIEIGIRHFVSYKYKDLWIVIPQELSNVSDNNKDTLHLALTDSKGNWLGSGIGGLLQHTIKLPKKYIINDSINQPIIYITHLMKDSLLHGINDIGIKIDKVR